LNDRELVERGAGAQGEELARRRVRQPLMISSARSAGIRRSARARAQGASKATCSGNSSG
jgi:hypothetical protein